jgi:hypothetical protein
MRMDVQEPAAEDLEIFGSLGQALSVSLERRSALNALLGTKCRIDRQSTRNSASACDSSEEIMGCWHGSPSMI